MLSKIFESVFSTLRIFLSYEKSFLVKQKRKTFIQTSPIAPPARAVTKYTIFDLKMNFKGNNHLDKNSNEYRREKLLAKR